MIVRRESNALAQYVSHPLPGLEWVTPAVSAQASQLSDRL